MVRLARRKSKTGIYHIMLRGVNKQEIFHDDEDCSKFLSTVEKIKRLSGIKVYAWCLMRNHVHLLIKEGDEEISTTMKRLGISFVGYYHYKYRTTGHLFQDRFRSENVETNEYLLSVIRYIHQNPVKAGIVNLANEWRWSSLLEYGGKDVIYQNLLDSEDVLKMFSTDINYSKRIFIEFNNRKNEDECLDERGHRQRLLDEEASQEIKRVLGEMEIAHVKSLPRLYRNEVLQQLKKIEGLTNRQASRILGISVNIVAKA